MYLQKCTYDRICIKLRGNNQTKGKPGINDQTIKQFECSRKNVCLNYYTNQPNDSELKSPSVCIAEFSSGKSCKIPTNRFFNPAAFTPAPHRSSSLLIFSDLSCFVVGVFFAAADECLYSFAFVLFSVSTVWACLLLASSTTGS